MEEKKRAWFQIHLSTAVVLMFVAALLLWVNLEKHWVYPNAMSHSGSRGWPFAMRKDLYEWIYLREEPHILYDALAANLLIALAILFVVWCVCEWFIRRRAK